MIEIYNFFAKTLQFSELVSVVLMWVIVIAVPILIVIAILWLIGSIFGKR